MSKDLLHDCLHSHKLRACFLVNQSKGEWLMQCRTPVTACSVTQSWQRLASMQQVNTTGFPSGLGASMGSTSVTLPQTLWDQSWCWGGTADVSDQVPQFQMQTKPWFIFTMLGPTIRFSHPVEVTHSWSNSEPRHGGICHRNFNVKLSQGKSIEVHQ